MTLTEDESEADVILVNTCSIREKAQEKVFSPARPVEAAEEGASRIW
jgi:tRNA-2-methylthio-N6-dimethylallyladenosine synthase